MKANIVEIRVCANGYVVFQSEDYGQGAKINYGTTHVFETFPALCNWLKANLAEINK